MDPVQNPFRPGAGTQPPALVGRDDLIDDFGIALRRALYGRPGKCRLLTGLRGVGKTVLLNRFAEIASHEGVESAFIEAPEQQPFATLLASRLRRVLLGWQSSTSGAVTRALRVLKSFTLQLPEGASISVDVEAFRGVGDSGLLELDLTDLLEECGRAAEASRSGLLIVVDEVQYLKAPELGALIAAVHRTTQLGLPVVLAGAGLPQLPRLAGQARSYAERLCEFPTVTSLPPASAGAAITEPAEALGVALEPGAVERIVQDSAGYPYFLQEWGFQVWNAAPMSRITADDVEAARPSVIHTLDRDFFRVRLDRATPKEREYLSAMARLGPGPHRSGDIAAELRVKVESVAPRRSNLISKGLIYSPAHGETAFTVPLFDQFLLRNPL